MGFKRSQRGASARPSLPMSPHWGKGEEVEGQPELMPPTHFVFRPDLLLLHQRWRQSLNIFVFTWRCPVSASDTLEFKLEGWLGEFCSWKLYIMVIYILFFLLPSLQRHL